MKTRTEMKIQRFSFGWSEKLGQAVKMAADDFYPIECHFRSDDFTAIKNAINQGIDSHLEAIFFTQREGSCGRARFEIHPESLPVLVRRLLESGDENAEHLASSICDTLNIELI